MNEDRAAYVLCILAGFIALSRFDVQPINYVASALFFILAETMLVLDIERNKQVKYYA